ncbi:MAG TPA: ribonuclease R [Thermoanaerobaculia bacterium]|nr:ribonuclease R [Thermoanaerobaculia bacterium]
MSDLELKEQITALLRAKGNRVLAIRDIHERLGASTGVEHDREEIERAVEEMERSGQLIAVRGKRYSLLEFTPYAAGRIRVFSDGDASVGPSDPESLGYHISRRALKGAMNGDLVMLLVDRKKKAKEFRGRQLLEAEVSKVLQRAHRTVVGRFHLDDRPWVTPFDAKLDSDIRIPPDATMDARDGEMVNVEIERYASQNADASGRVVEVLGMIGDPGVDIEVVIRKHGIPHQFPDDVLRAADSIPSEISVDEIAGRVDLRERVIITIDGETAKDFDDAVDVERLDNGNYQLGVHIADVSHYVTEGSLLDREAFERGTSVYFPGRAVPMLPERLSNGICSLNPRVDRLTFSAVLEIDPKGRVLDRRMFRSVIRTSERMTYTDVNALLTDPDPKLEERYRNILDHLRRMHELYEILRKRRTARGSIDFDLPSADVLLGEQGEIESIIATQRNVAHRLVEEFMLAANEAVARQLVLASQPGLFRVHQQPDPRKLEDLKSILEEFKVPLRGDIEEIRPGELQRVLNKVAGTPESLFLTELVLRSMKRAFYADESLGHFALALQHYCHFTSPIRRYPDLIVHRRLGELVAEGPLHGDQLARVESKHPAIALQSSERERRAEGAEREVLEWKKVVFMRDKVGLEFDGRITGVMPFGLFVELEEVFVQGMVPVATIGGDFWVFAEREHRLRGEQSAREFRLGDPVRVRVESIDEDRRQVEFRLVASGGVPIAQRERESGRRRR